MCSSAAARSTWRFSRALSRLLHPQAEGDVLEHRHVREHGVVLEHHREAALARRAGRLTSRPPISDAPGGLRLEAGDDAQQRGLAAAGRAEQGDELAVGDGERHLLQRATEPKILRCGR